MSQRNYQDAASGLLIAVFGVAVSLYAVNQYNIGSIQRMGPGMFPVAMGVGLGVLGALLALFAWLRPGLRDGMSVQWRPALLVLGAIGFFALAVTFSGLIPAVLGVVLISALADSKTRPRQALLLATALAVLAYLIFQLALDMNFDLF
ncbi:tripartite tricarboxylate transporter TctB family protein [Pseudomonas sp. G34]|uniref:tripartite tricarboxylate transporter TctB family protein n=1 Tax=Pseudomonas sp. G34 TaxID=3059083 RepID=UPI00280A18E5|nr:tripartite tricarboxylate transporter TctB family protein [Pseudomonas sp. G34]MDQ7983777.1 tripartite tricarboxylate transporter TctB family protein [Pseudomonas sp. G34]